MNRIYATRALDGLLNEVLFPTSEKLHQITAVFWRFRFEIGICDNNFSPSVHLICFPSLSTLDFRVSRILTLSPSEAWLTILTLYKRMADSFHLKPVKHSEICATSCGNKILRLSDSSPSQV